MSVPVGYKTTEVGVIPDDWEVKTLKDVGQPLIGLTYSPRDVRESGTLVLRSSNVQNGVLAFRDNVFVDPNVAEKALVQANDILICVRNGSRELIGKCAKVDDKATGMAFGAFMSIFRSNDHGFVFHQFRSDSMRRQINEHLGATINQITNSSLNGFKIAWPPNESERDAVTETLSDMDETIAAQEAVIAKKRALKTATMQALLTRTRRLPGFSGAWGVKAFGEIATIRNDKILTYGSEEAMFCVELEHIEQSSGKLLSWSDAKRRRTTKFRFSPSDVLFGRLRPYLKKYWFSDRSGVCSTEIWPLVPKSAEFCASYLYQVVQTDQFIEKASTAYGTHMPRADWSFLSQAEIYVPTDPYEQVAISEILSAMDHDIRDSQAKLKKLSLLKSGMMQQLLTGKIRLK